MNRTVLVASVAACLLACGGGVAPSGHGPRVLLAVDFGNETTAKTGAAAVGSPGDVWNPAFSQFSSPTTLTGLVGTDGTPSGVTLTLTNLAGLWSAVPANGDPMYADYVYNLFSGTSASVDIQGLPAGTYDVYLYGHGPSDDADTGYSLAVDGVPATCTTYTGMLTPAGATWTRGNEAAWTEQTRQCTPSDDTHGQYVKLTANLAKAQTLTVELIEDPAGPHGVPPDSHNASTILNGMQIVSRM